MNNIMIVEDEALIALSLQNKLEKLGYHVPAVVHTGEEAVEEAKMLTQQSIEQKKNQIEEEKLLAKVSLEDKKKDLVKLQSENTISYAKARAESMRMELESINSLQPELLEILAANQMDSSKIISRALRDIAKNAEKIGNLNISPELLTSLIGDKK